MGNSVKASTDKSLHAFGAADCPHLSRFGKLVGLINRLYGVDLSVPNFPETGLECLSSLKDFCSGLIERRSHTWRVPLRRLGIRSRMSIAHTLFLFRKTLPAKEPNLDDFLDVISRPAPEPDVDFLDFCRYEIRKMFRVGWDNHLYPNACISVSVSTSSCRENGRTFGGCRKWVLDEKMPDISDREAFQLSVLTKTKYQRPPPSRLVSIDTGGKWRKITVPSGELSQLKPLHQSIYNHISKFDWLLRGKESASVFSNFTREVGEIFVSGDYESATDFLNTRVSKEVLAEILMRSRSVPHGISMMAMDSLSLPVSLQREDGTVRQVDQKSGQMMGYLLSFPLLCIINYLTFKFVVRRDVPVKVNGDDIVFRGTRSEYTKWKEMVGKSGLVLSAGKTMISSRFFTLNSCLFVSERHRVKTLPFVRSTALFPKVKDPEAVMGLSGRYRSFAPGFSGVQRDLLRVSFLKLNRSIIDVTRRSLSRGLGLCVSFPVLVESGLWPREAWHLSLESESPVPAPFSEWSSPPKDYKFIRVPRITKEIRRSSEGVGSAFVDAAWQSPRGGQNDWFAELKSGSFDCGHWFLSRASGIKKRARLLGLSPRNANRFLRPRRSLFKDDAFKSKKFSAWVKEDFSPTMKFSSENGRVFFCDLRTSAHRNRDATEDNIDYRDYLVPSVSVDEIFIGVNSSLLGEGSFISRGHRLNLTRGKGLAVRELPTGRGFAPPPCLVDSQLYESTHPMNR